MAAEVRGLLQQTAEAARQSEQLEELLARWTDNDVTHAQPVAHVLGTGQPAGAAAPQPEAPPAELSLASQGARIGFF